MREPPPLTEEREPNNDARAREQDRGRHAGHRLPRQAPLAAATAIATRSSCRGRRAAGASSPCASPACRTSTSTSRVTDGDGLHGAIADEGGVGEGEVLHRRAIDGPLVITVGETRRRRTQLPVENVSDPYTLTVTEDNARPARPSRTARDADANPLELDAASCAATSTRATTSTCCAGPATTAPTTSIVRADGLPLAWRIGDGKLRTPGAAQVKLDAGRVDPARAHRSRRPTAPLPGARYDVVGGGDAVRRTLRVRRVTLLVVTLALVAAAMTATTRACPPGAFADGDPNGHADPLGASADRGARRTHPRRSDLPVGAVGARHVEGRRLRARERSRRARDRGCRRQRSLRSVGRPARSGSRASRAASSSSRATSASCSCSPGARRSSPKRSRVINDGSDGKPGDHPRARQAASAAVLREPDRASSTTTTYTDIDAAIDYELAPGAEHVDIRMRYASPRDEPTRTCRRRCTRSCTRSARRVFQPTLGFDEQLNGAPYIALVDDRRDELGVRARRRHARQLARRRRGFLGAFTPRLHDPGVRHDRSPARADRDRRARASTASQAAVARTLGDAAARDHRHRHARRRRRPRASTSTRSTAATYLTRATTDADGAFTLHVPADARTSPRRVHARRRDRHAPRSAPARPRRSTLPATGAIHVVATENGTRGAGARAGRARRRPDRADACPTTTASRRSPAAALARRVRGRPATSRCRAARHVGGRSCRAATSTSSSRQTVTVAADQTVAGRRAARSRRRYDEHPVRRLPRPHVALERLRRRRARQGRAGGRRRRRDAGAQRSRVGRRLLGGDRALGVAGVRVRHRLDRADVVRGVGPHGRVPARRPTRRRSTPARRSGRRSRPPTRPTRRSRRCRRRSCSTPCARAPRRRS